MGQKEKEKKAKDQDTESPRDKASGNHNGQQQAAKNQKRKRKEIAPYGNYRNYYGYRIGQSFDEDPRLKVFRKEWFQDKDCLDIGCNSGIITIDIAKKFHCQSILGIDIDSNRIEDAFWNLRRVEKLEITGKVHSKVPKLEGKETLDGIENSVTGLQDEGTRSTSKDSSHSVERALSDIVSFRQENFVTSRHTPQGQLYDTIVCLSVTKWIHLNWGDDGLITFFSKIWKHLHPGGILVLEPQPWSSYRSNHRVSETTQTNYHNIMFHPECFQELLLDKIGFRRVEDLTSSLPGSNKGFSRPILVFYK